MAGPDSSTGHDKKGPQLVGDVNEAEIQINNIDTKALLDTGSCISILAKQFYEDHLSTIEMKPLKQILNIECADAVVCHI